MRKVAYLLIILSIVISSCAPRIENQNSQTGSQNSANLESCNIDNGDSCTNGYTCYFSQTWPKGGEQGKQTGDLKCHKNCNEDADCESTTTCKEVDLGRGDIIIRSKFCI